jgi:hypothetical protein
MSSGRCSWTNEGWAIPCDSTTNAGMMGTWDRRNPQLFSTPYSQKAMDGELGPDWYHSHGTAADNPRSNPMSFRR